MTSLINIPWLFLIKSVSSRVGNPPFLMEPPPPPPFLGTPSFWSKFKKLTPLSESHPNWYMQIVWNTLKPRSCILYYTESIKNIIIITFYTFRLNSVLTADSLVRLFGLFDMQEEWTWNISNNYIIKSDVCIKLKYIRISLDNISTYILPCRIKERKKLI